MLEAYSTITKCRLVTLLILNGFFIAVGGAALYFGIWFKQDGWLDAFDGNELWIGNGMYITALVVAGLIIFISLLGFAGAYIKERCLLATYATSIGVAALIFIAVAAAGFYLFGTASSWSDESFPADRYKEPLIAKNFNTMYCYSQAAHYCNSADIKSVLNLLAPIDNQPALKSIANALAAGLKADGIDNVQDMCADYANNGTTATLLKLVPSFNFTNVCSSCERADKFSKYNSLFAWGNRECPLDSTTSHWCINLLTSGKELLSQYDGAPYEACRPQVFRLIKQWSPIIAGIAAGAALGALFVVFIAIEAGRRAALEDAENKLKAQGTSDVYDLKKTHRQLRRVNTPPL